MTRPSERVAHRRMAIVLLVLFLAAVAVNVAKARDPWQRATASSYSAASTGSTVQGCPGAPPLRDDARSFASLLVPCGAHVRFCYRGRCATGVRTDSGPFLHGRFVASWRGFDLNVGLVRALGFPSPVAFGVRRLTWARVR